MAFDLRTIKKALSRYLAQFISCINEIFLFNTDRKMTSIGQKGKIVYYFKTLITVYNTRECFSPDTLKKTFKTR